VDVLVIVFAKLLFLLFTPASKRLLKVPLCVFAANHESNLAGRVGRDSGVCIFDVGEYFFAVGLELGDQGQVQPLVLS